MAITLISILYFAATLGLAHVKPLWNDELFTFYIARRPGMRGVWDALLTGAEQLPPLFYAITKASVGIFGYTHIGIRLPEILGFWVMSASLYAVALRFASAPYAMLAAVFPFLTGAYDYAYEARPYALVLGFCGFALWCWFEATDGSSRRYLAIVGLAVSLAAALTCHYYAILAFLPLAAGEAVRSWQRRRLDFAILIAFLVALAPLVVLFPLLRAAHSYAATFWAKPHWGNITRFYQAMLDPSGLLLFAAPLALVSHVLLNPENGASEGRSPISLSGLVALLGFALLPVAAIILGMTITHAYTDRHAIMAVIGLTGILVWALSRIASNDPIPALLLTALGVALFIVHSARDYQSRVRSASAYEQNLRFLGEHNGGHPVAIQDPHLFFELSALWNGQPGLDLVYIFDRDRALAYTDTDDVELGLMTLRSWAPLHLEKFNDFVTRKSPILIYGDPAVYGWLMPELERDRWSFTVLAHNPVKAVDGLLKDGEQLLFLATPPANR